MDLPEVKAIITQFTLTKYRCKSCGKNSSAELPEGVPNSAFGPKLMGLIAMLTGGLHLAIGINHYITLCVWRGSGHPSIFIPSFSNSSSISGAATEPSGN